MCNKNSKLIILEIEKMIKKTPYTIKSLLINFKNYCYGVIISTREEKEEFYFPIEYSAYISYTKYNLVYYPISKTSSFVSYTKNDFHANEQIDLCKKIIELDERGCFVMLSNSDCDFIRNLYTDLKNFKLYQVYATRSINSDASKRGKISEIVIANY